MAVCHCSQRSSRVLLPVAMAVCSLAGCTVATEYVPRTPGRATIGIERGRIGVYKNSAFTRLTADAPRSLACSPQALADAARAGAHAEDFERNTTISNIGWSLLFILPPLAAFGAAFGAAAESDRRQSFALAVDAVNRNNDTMACLQPATPAIGARL